MSTPKQDKDSSIVQQIRKNRRELGLCTYCDEKSVVGVLCQYHDDLVHGRILKREHVPNNPTTRKSRGLCILCEEPIEEGHVFCTYHLQMRRNKALSNGKRMKKIVHDHYGNKCQCCGEDNPAFLTVDHVNNDGSKQKKEAGISKGGGNFNRWLIDHDFPSGFQLLCWNCNCGKHFNGGVCSHKTKRKIK